VFRDAELAMVRLRANGNFAVRVTEPQLFVNQIVGSQGRYTIDAIESYLRDVVVAGSTTSGLDAQDDLRPAAALRRARGGAQGARRRDFAKYGLEMTDFFVGAITPPEDVQRVIDERTGMAAVGDQNTYLKFKAAQAMGDAAKNPRATAGGVAESAWASARGSA
jgi:membrane protease subunit (stomatin/prohibitin family)